MRCRSSLLPTTLALTLAILSPGCEKDSSPTEPPPAGGPTITAASGALVALAGTWQSACFTAPAGSPVASVRESFVISEFDIVIAVTGFLGANCSGISITEDLEVDYSLGAEATARLGSSTVGVTRVNGTVRDSGEPFLQIFHIDDAGTHHLFHGELDDPPTDDAGYPTELFDVSLERQ